MLIGMGAGSHLGIDLSEYDARIRTFIPDYGMLHDAVAGALGAAVRRRGPTIVELGIGTGALAARCLEACPSARMVGVDEDAAMLAAAQVRLGDGLRTTIQDNFESIDLPRCDAIVACLALHHVPPGPRRLRLFRRLYKRLRPRGVLISADCYPAADPRLAEADRAAWIAHLEKSYPPHEVRGFFRRWAREDHYVPLLDEIVTLRRAGFTVDVSWRKQSFAVIVATA
jgi:tRNA (cmo5U34)-methyltransferase